MDEVCWISVLMLEHQEECLVVCVRELEQYKLVQYEAESGDQLAPPISIQARPDGMCSVAVGDKLCLALSNK